jgi:hypothetical protein
VTGKQFQDVRSRIESEPTCCMDGMSEQDVLQLPNDILDLILHGGSGA